jgi:hypothetical protein
MHVLTLVYFSNSDQCVIEHVGFMRWRWEYTDGGIWILHSGTARTKRGALRALLKINKSYQGHQGDEND